MSHNFACVPTRLLLPLSQREEAPWETRATKRGGLQDLTIVEGSARLGRDMMASLKRSESFRSCIPTILALPLLGIGAGRSQAQVTNLSGGGSINFSALTSGNLSVQIGDKLFSNFGFSYVDTDGNPGDDLLASALVLSSLSNQVTDSTVSDQRRFPNPQKCRTRYLGRILDLSDCLMGNPDLCKYAVSFGFAVYCYHPDRRSFEKADGP